MITVKENENRLLIKCSVSEFSFCMTYCEHKIPFYLGDIKPPVHVESEIRKSIGSIFHAKEEKKDKEKVKPITKEELSVALPDKQKSIEFTREHVFSKLSYFMSKDNKDIQLILTGRPDKLLRKDEFLIVEEDKFPKNPFIYVNRKNPFDSHILQSLIYLNSKFSIKSSSPKKEIDRYINRNNTVNTSQGTINMFFDMVKEDSSYQNVNKHIKQQSAVTQTANGSRRKPTGTTDTVCDAVYSQTTWFDIPHLKKKWVVNIRNSESGDTENNIIKTFEGMQNENDEIFLQEKMSRFVSLVLDSEQRYHHGNFKKCVPCEYADICKFSLKT